MMTPARVAFVVEYPGYLRDANDTSGLLRTLGGEEHLAEVEVVGIGLCDPLAVIHDPSPRTSLRAIPRIQAFVDVDQVTSKVSTSSTAVLQQDKKVELELRYRPDDLCSHPIQGVVLPYRGVLMRLKWRRRRGVANAPRELYSMEPMCTLNKVGRFREMADFQVCVDQSAAVPTLMRNLTTGNLASVLDFTGLPADEEEEMQPLAPLYSHIQVPLKYDFKQNTGVEKQGERYVHRDHLNKLAEAPNVRFSDRELPSGPPVGLSPAPADLDVKLRKMFDER